MASITQRSFFSRNLEYLGMAAVCAVILGGACLFVDGFASAQNASALLLAIYPIGILCCSMLLCMVSGDFDLSVGSVVAVAGMVAVGVGNKAADPAGWGLGPAASVSLAVAAGLGAGAAVGAFNGFVVAFLRINPFITTLATMQLARGLAFLSGGPSGATLSVQVPAFSKMGGSFQIPWFADAAGDPTHVSVGYPVLVMIGCLIVFGVLLHLSIFGRSVLAMGGNEEAARLAGIPVRRTRFLVFVLQGLLAGLVGILLSAQLGTAAPQAGTGLELKVMSACVLGGVALTGGRGTILAVIWGMLIMGAAQKAMDLYQVPIFFQYLVSGGILLAAVIVDRFKTSFSGKTRFFAVLKGAASQPK